MKNKKLSAFSFIELSIVILIIGILVAGIVSSSRLVGQYRITSARNTSSSSSIASIQNMVLWMDVVAENKLTNTSDVAPVDGDRVKTWVDANPQSTTPLTFTQSSAGAGPIYKTNGINNLPALYYQGTVAGGTGTGESLAGCLTNGAYDATINPGRFTAFFVLQPLVDVTSNSGSVFSSIGSGTGYSLTKTASKLTTKFAGSTAVDVTASVRNSYIVTMIRNSTAQNYYLNGTAGVAVTASYTANSDTATGIGCTATPGLYFNGYISEIIIFDRDLKAEERQSVETYLSKKYAIKLI